jgi:hypothetical protein
MLRKTIILLATATALTGGITSAMARGGGGGGHIGGLGGGGHIGGFGGHIGSIGMGHIGGIGHIGVGHIGGLAGQPGLGHIDGLADHLGGNHGLGLAGHLGDGHIGGHLGGLGDHLGRVAGPIAVEGDPVHEGSHIAGAIRRDHRGDHHHQKWAHLGSRYLGSLDDDIYCDPYVMNPVWRVKKDWDCD